MCIYILRIVCMFFVCVCVRLHLPVDCAAVGGLLLLLLPPRCKHMYCCMKHSQLILLCFALPAMTSLVLKVVRFRFEAPARVLLKIQNTNIMMRLTLQRQRLILLLIGFFFFRPGEIGGGTGGAACPRALGDLRGSCHRRREQGETDWGVVTKHPQSPRH